MTVSAEPKPLRKAVDPERLRRLMDSPSVSNATRDVPAAITKRATLETSWNRELADVRAFHKLAPPPNVVPTKDLRAESIDVDRAHRSGLQMSDVAVVSSGSNPADVDHLMAPVMTQKESFAHAAAIEYKPVPSSVLLHEGGIMTPQQRRERLQFEGEHNRAKRALHQAELNRQRLHQIIKERHSTSDVMGTSHPSSEGGTRPHRGERFKPDLLSYDESGNLSRDGYQRAFQSKNSAANPRLDHHARIFNETPLERDEQRAQMLRNESSAGRAFDIVSGARVGFYAPTIAEKQHARQAHPSVSLHPYTR